MGLHALLTHLLDTNVCIRYINGRSPQLRTRIRIFDLEQIAVCAIVKAEMFFGSLRSQNPIKSRQVQDEFLRDFISLPFDDLAAEHYARIRADLANRGTLIGPNDLMIAAITLANNLILVTHNTAEYSRVSGLRLEDWELPN